MSINAGGGHIAAMYSLKEILEEKGYIVDGRIIEKNNVESIHKFLVKKAPYIYEFLYNLSKIKIPNFLNTIRIIFAGRINGLYEVLKKRILKNMNMY